MPYKQLQTSTSRVETLLDVIKVDLVEREKKEKKTLSFETIRDYVNPLPRVPDIKGACMGVFPRYPVLALYAWS